jgi:hypothetical protein
VDCFKSEYIPSRIRSFEQTDKDINVAPTETE